MKNKLYIFGAFKQFENALDLLKQIKSSDDAYSFLDDVTRKSFDETVNNAYTTFESFTHLVSNNYPSEFGEYDSKLRDSGVIAKAGININALIKLANHLDANGHYNEAGRIDSIIKKICGERPKYHDTNNLIPVDTLALSKEDILMSPAYLDKNIFNNFDLLYEMSKISKKFKDDKSSTIGGLKREIRELLSRNGFGDVKFADEIKYVPKSFVRRMEEYHSGFLE